MNGSDLDDGFSGLETRGFQVNGFDLDSALSCREVWCQSVRGSARMAGRETQDDHCLSVTNQDINDSVSGTEVIRSSGQMPCPIVSDRVFSGPLRLCTFGDCANPVSLTACICRIYSLMSTF